MPVTPLFYNNYISNLVGFIFLFNIAFNRYGYGLCMHGSNKNGSYTLCVGTTLIPSTNLQLIFGRQPACELAFTEISQEPMGSYSVVLVVAGKGRQDHRAVPNTPHQER